MIKYIDFRKEVKSSHYVGIWGQLVYKVLPLWRKSQHILRTSKWFAILMIIWTTDSDHKEGHSSKHNQKLYFWSLVVGCKILNIQKSKSIWHGFNNTLLCYFQYYKFMHLWLLSSFLHCLFSDAIIYICFVLKIMTGVKMPKISGFLCGCGWKGFCQTIISSDFYIFCPFLCCLDNCPLLLFCPAAAEAMFCPKKKQCEKRLIVSWTINWD